MSMSESRLELEAMRKLLSIRQKKTAEIVINDFALFPSILEQYSRGASLRQGAFI